MISSEARLAPAFGGTGAQPESLAQRALHVIPAVTSHAPAFPGHIMMPRLSLFVRHTGDEYF